MSTERIAVGGSAANPPHLGHRFLVHTLLTCGRFDQVLWIPSGVRADKPDFVEPDHRVAMTLLTFPASWWWKFPTAFLIKFEDVYGENTPTIGWLERLQEEHPKAETIWFTGVDSVVPEERFGGKCEIAACWKRGEELMRGWPFLILPRVGYPHPSTLNLPKQFAVLDINQSGLTSTGVRERIAAGQPFEHLVTRGVAAYIKRHGLYGYGGPNKERGRGRCSQPTD